MNSVKATAMLVGAMALLAAAAGGANVFAQEPKATAKDYNQRAREIYEFRKAAASGPERGQEIFYYKCWFCHNEFVQGIPQLKGLYQNSKLLSGESVNDDTVKEKIRNGGAGMAAYKYTLSDPDLNDLVSYLREKCCWNSDTPPLNPRYRMRLHGGHHGRLHRTWFSRGHFADRTAGFFPLTLARCTCPDRSPAVGRPARHRQIRKWRAARRDHGSADRAEECDPDHGLQQRGRTLRIPQA